MELINHIIEKLWITEKIRTHFSIQRKNNTLLYRIIRSMKQQENLEDQRNESQIIIRVEFREMHVYQKSIIRRLEPFVRRTYGFSAGRIALNLIMNRN